MPAPLNAAPRNDTELVRYAIDSGLVDRALGEAALARHGDGSAAITDLIEHGAIDRARVVALRHGVVEEPERLGPYRLYDVLGHGGMGVVYRARDDADGEVAVKVLSPQLALDPVYQQRFLREGRAASTIVSPFVVRCLGAGEDAGRFYIAMELMRGGNAEEEAERHRGGRLPPARCLAVLRDAAEGLEAIHAAGLVHRDLKPANLFLDERGRAKLGDFGIARLPEDDNATRLTAVGRTLGTPSFMAPEQASAAPDVDIRADIYALGATLYCLVTGQPPFIGSSNWLVMSQALAKPLPDPRDLVADCPVAISAIVRGAGALKREDRYASPRELREDLQRAVAGEAPLHAASAPAMARADLRAVTAQPRDRRILIVDADPLLTRIHQGKFAGAGWTVEVVGDGPAALARLDAFRPSVVLLDLVLPGMDGAELIRRIRADPLRRALPIVVLSNAYFEEELRAARDAGADVVLSKVDHGPRQVLEAIERALAMETPARSGPVRTPAGEPPSGRIEGGIARSGRPALAAALRGLDLVGTGPDERGVLLEIGNRLRPIAGLASAARAAYAATLASATESLARLLHSWPRHVNASSVRTLRQALVRLDGVFAGDTAPDPAGARALVVDADAVSRNTMAQAMRKVQFHVDVCGDGDAAFAALTADPVDVVLADADHDGDGVDLAARLRADPRLAAIPVVLVAGAARFEALRADGAIDAIAKPFLLMELAAKALVHLR